MGEASRKKAEREFSEARWTREWREAIAAACSA
jgi:hypothetical protein